MHSLDDTIAAVASPPGGAARGIVRVSGPDAFSCVARFFRENEPASEHCWGGSCTAAPGASEHCWGGSCTAAPGRQCNCRPNEHDCPNEDDCLNEHDCPSEHRKPLHPHATTGALHLPGLESPLPCEAYFWPDGRSYTGQAVVELHTIGSPPLLQIVMRSLCSAGVRLAEPGEFTLRAFLAGRIDLSQAEAVLGVIDAADRRELDVALRQLAGGLARPLHDLRDSLLDLLSHLEAGFDFADEEIPFIERDELLSRLDEAGRVIAETIAKMASRGESVGLVNAVLIGRPNVGKSSLFNALAADGAALVADLPGTTRDYLVAELDLDGIKCRLIDTAGRREEQSVASGELPLAVLHELETAAQAAAAEQSQNANIRVLCLDSTQRPDEWEIDGLRDGDDRRRIVVLTKCDAPDSMAFDFSALRTSSTTGEGVEQLRAELRRKLSASLLGESDVVADTALRCRESLTSAAGCIERARHVASSEQDELAASEIRAALEELGRVVGAVYTDDVLDRIFSRFCIGK